MMLRLVSFLFVRKMEKTIGPIFVKLSGRMRHGPRKPQLNVGLDQSFDRLGLGLVYVYVNDVSLSILFQESAIVVQNSQEKPSRQNLNKLQRVVKTL